MCRVDVLWFIVLPTNIGGERLCGKLKGGRLAMLTSSKNKQNRQIRGIF